MNKTKFLRIAAGGATVVVAALFFYAGASKMENPQVFADAIAAYRMLPDALINPVALVLPPLEVIVAVCVCIPVLRGAGLLLMGGMTIVFLMALAQAALRGLVVDCGCFGGGEASAWKMVLSMVRDGVLLVAIGWLYTRRLRVQENCHDSAMRSGKGVCARNFCRIGVVLLFLAGTMSLEGRHFEISNERVLWKQPMNERGKFAPCLEVKLRVASDMPVGKSYARAYFFAPTGKMIGKPVNPIPTQYEKGNPASLLPFYFKQNKAVTVRFLLPVDLKKQDPEWRAVVVFGDDRDATSLLAAESKRTILGDFANAYNFPERKLCLQDSATRGKNEERLTEVVCLTNLPDYPRYTLFARLPRGVARGRDAKGVLCLSLLAHQVSDVRLALMNNEAKGDIADMISYADNKQLIVLCWAIKAFWNSGKNWDDLTPAEAQTLEYRFGRVASAWETGVKKLAAQYGFEPRNFLIWGYSNSAQFAGRLALKKPEYFAAVHMQNPGSFGKPVAAASKILWSLTMGEVDSGYGRAVKFQEKCHELGYPLIFKAVPGMGHDNDRRSRQLATLVFEYVRSLPADPAQREKALMVGMENAPFYGDWLNQTMEKNENRDQIPRRLRVALPTEKLAKIWLRETPLPASEDPATPPAAPPMQTSGSTPGPVSEMTRPVSP